MNLKNFTLVLLACLSFIGSGTAQSGLQMKLQVMPGGLEWGVYLKTVGITPSNNITTASGQVTIVMPANFSFTGPFNVGGQWDENATVISPVENTGRKYVSFGLLQAEPLYPINYQTAGDILLFSIKGTSCPDSIFLIDCNSPNITDPFCPDFPDSNYGLNSAFSNPGLELSVVDFGAGTLIYGFEDIYARSAWNCNDCDGDGVVNGIEDSNGDGEWTPGVDAGNLCGPCDIPLPLGATISGNATLCAGGQAEIKVDINGGVAPFTVLISDGAASFSIANYQSGAPIPVSPSATTTYTLLSVSNNPVCVLNTGLQGSAVVQVTSGLAITAFTTSSFPEEPAPCEAYDAIFNASILNESNSTVSLAWQHSCDGGATWEDFETEQPSAAAQINVALSVSSAEISQMSGCQWRLQATSAGCGSVVSETVELEQGEQIAFAQQPQSTVVCEGSQAEFHANTTAQGANFQWQMSCDGQTWADLANGLFFTNVNTPSLRIEITGLAMSGCQLRLKAGQGDCAEIISQAATLTVTPPAKITQDLQPQVVCPGEEAVLHFETDMPGHYIWMRSPSNGLYWDVVDVLNTDQTPEQSVSLTIPANEVAEGHLYHAIFLPHSDFTVCGLLSTDTVLLTAREPLAITAHPAPQLICAGANTTFEAAVADVGEPVDYRWQQSCDGGATWADIADADPQFENAASTSLAVRGAGLDISTCRYRLKAAYAGCAPSYSNAAALAVQNPAGIISQPPDITACADVSVQFGTDVEFGSNTSFLWQYTTNGVDFVDADNSINGWNSFVLNSLNVQQFDGHQFRLQITDEICDRVLYSELSTINAIGEITVAQSLADYDGCEGDPVVFLAEALADEQDYVQVQWQQQLPGSQAWADLAEGQNYTGVNAEALAIASNAGLNGTSYRLKATGTCQSTETPAASLTTQDCSIDSHFVDIKLQVRPDGKSWGVWITPVGGFEPHPYNLAHGARVTIAVPQSFGYQNLTSQEGGTWKAGPVLHQTPLVPGMMFYTFELTPENKPLELAAGEEIMLFSFENQTNVCPEKMYIMEGYVPPLVQPNFFHGIDLDENQFFLAEVYDHDAWECANANQGMMANTTGGNISTSTPVGTTQQNASLPAAIIGQPAVVLASPNAVAEMVLSPNPASGHVTVSFGKLEGPAQVKLLNLQGQLLQQTAVEAGGGSVVFGLSEMPVGLYLVALEVDGQVVQREKLMVR